MNNTPINTNELYEFMYAVKPEVWFSPDDMRYVTTKEITFIEKAMGLASGSAILDVGCGTGRHSLEAARRGHNVTGVDISGKLISKASSQARVEGLKIDFRIGDMRTLDFEGRFDAVIFMDVSFGIFDDIENQKVMKNALDALKPGGKALFSLFNPYWWASHPHTRHWKDTKGEVIRTYSFNGEEGRVEDRQIYINMEEGIRKELPIQSLRAYTPAEMKRMTINTGFTSFQIYGDRGDFIPGSDIRFHPEQSMGLYVVCGKQG